MSENGYSDHKLMFSKRGTGLVGQEMFKVLDKAHALESQGIDIIHLELGNPRLKPPVGVVEETVNQLQAGNFGYTSSAGLMGLRQAIVDRYNRLLNCGISVENVAISPANFLINQFLDLVCDPGDRVVFFSPAFPTYWAAAANIGLEVEDIQLDPKSAFDLTRADVDRAFASDPKAILVNSANNPTGAVYSKEVLEYLSDECNRRGIWLLSDETYVEICYDGPCHSCVYDTGSYVVVISSFSKLFSVPGFRTGYVIAAPEVIDKLVLSTSTQISCLPGFTQLGCAAGFEAIDDYVVSISERFKKATSLSADIINNSGILHCSSPKSGFYVFVDISRTDMNDMDFCQKLLEDHHTAVTPGRSFGSAYLNFVRIATCGDIDDVKEGVRRLISFAAILAKSDVKVAS